MHRKPIQPPAGKRGSRRFDRAAERRGSTRVAYCSHAARAEVDVAKLRQWALGGRTSVFPRGADHQVGIGLPRGIQVFADGFYGHRVDEFATVAVAHARQARRDRTQVFCGQQADGNQSDAIKRLRLRKL